MKPQSAKSKGRRLQQEVRDAILARFPDLEPDDVRCTSMGAPGEDVPLSPLARRKFPYAIECGNQERLNIWAKIKQAQSHAGDELTPLVVFKRNHSKPWVALPLDAFLEALK